jgi:hypothetical protein
MSEKISFMKPKEIKFDDRYYDFNTDTKVEKIMFPLNKTLIFKVNNQEFKFNFPIYSIWTMERVSVEINKILMEYQSIKKVSVDLI